MISSQQQRVMDDLLIEAVRAKDLPLAKLYIQKGANPRVDLSVPEIISTPGGSYSSSSGRAPLFHLAFSRGVYNEAMLTFLLSCGVDVDTKNHNGNTALMLAVKCGEQGKAEFLLSKGADPLSTNTSSDMVLDEARKLPESCTARMPLIKALLAKIKDSTADPVMPAQNNVPDKKAPAPQGEIKIMKPVTIGQKAKGNGGFRL
jgi:hypothetical protein